VIPFASILSELYEEIIEPIVNAIAGPFHAMVELLEAIGEWIAAGVMTAVNGVLHGVGIAVETLLELLPTFPERPVLSNIPGIGEAVGGLNWLFPVEGFLAFLLALAACLVAFLALRYLLTLLRAL
jgi:hypothetical protein